MGIERRKFNRISSRIPVEILEKGGIKTTTINVSRSGIFIEDTVERMMNSLVRVKLIVPPNQTLIDVFGRVVWKGKVAGINGVGINFHTLEGNQQKTWVEYVLEVEKLDAAYPSHGASVSGATTGIPVERVNEEKAMASFMVRHKDRDRFDKFVEHDLGGGGMFLKTPVLKPEGERVNVVIVHPESDEEFEMEAEVVRVNAVSNGEQPKGMALKFITPSPDRLAELERFLGAPVEIP